MRLINIEQSPRTAQGFVALISVVLISAILMLVAASLSFSGFYGRYNVLDSELKEQSTNIAESCVETALGRLQKDASYRPVSEMMQVGGNTCTIDDITATGTMMVIRTHATYSNYKTALDIEAKASDLSVISWEEVR